MDIAGTLSEMAAATRLELAGPLTEAQAAILPTLEKLLDAVIEDRDITEQNFLITLRGQVENTVQLYKALPNPPPIAERVKNVAAHIPKDSGLMDALEILGEYYSFLNDIGYASARVGGEQDTRAFAEVNWENSLETYRGWLEKIIAANKPGAEPATALERKLRVLFRFPRGPSGPSSGRDDPELPRLDR